MANIVSTFGTTESFVKSALMGLGATQEDPNGRFYLDGSMVHVELSRVVAEAIYIEEVIRDGQSVTGKYTTDREAGAVRVQLDTALPSTSRTTSYGGRKGTPGNGGVINVNPAMLPSDDEFMVYLNQVNDQAMLFPDLGKQYIPLDRMAKKIAGYAKSVAQDRSASTIAEMIAYAVFRSLNGGENLVQVADIKADNAYAELLNDLNSKMDNGDIPQGAYTYSTEGRTLLGRSNFINNAFSKNSGLILLGGDLSQMMLKEYDLDRGIGDRDYVGTGYRGKSLQFHFQSVPDYIWYLAERYLGIPAGALNNVLTLAVSFEATAMGRVVDLGVKMIDADGVRGIKAQPLNIWGHEAFRKSYLVGNDTLTNDYLTSTLGFTADNRIWPVAPATANSMDSTAVPIYGSDGAVVGYQVIAQTPKPNGGNFQSGLKQVSAPVASVHPGTYPTTQSVALSSATAGTTIYYTTDGSVPSSQSTQYAGAISVATSTTIRAIAIKTGMIPSPISEFAYVIGV